MYIILFSCCKVLSNQKGGSSDRYLRLFLRFHFQEHPPVLVHLQCKMLHSYESFHPLIYIIFLSSWHGLVRACELRARHEVVSYFLRDSSCNDVSYLLRIGISCTAYYFLLSTIHLLRCAIYSILLSGICWRIYIDKYL